MSTQTAPSAVAERLFAGVACSLLELLSDLEAPWDVVARCSGVLEAIARREVLGEVHPSAVIDGEVLIEAGAVVQPHVYICGPTIIRAGAVVRQGAFIRGHCLLEPGSIVGHATEVKNAVLLAGAAAPHFAYVGDSVIGEKSNLGAGVKLANVRVVPGMVGVRIGDQRFDTGLRKLGAILGPGVKVGCNAVLNPGTILEAGCIVYAGVSVGGHHAEGSVIRE